MEKYEKLVLRAFKDMKVPIEFDRGVEMTLFIDSIHGLVQRSLSNERLTKEEVSKYTLSKHYKEDLDQLISGNTDNLIFYNILKTCILIMHKLAI